MESANRPARKSVALADVVFRMTNPAYSYAAVETLV